MKHRYKNKKGFEISINFIVMVILSLVMLGVGFYFAKQIFAETIDIGNQLDFQTKQQLESKLRDPSALVAIGINKKNIKRGDHDAFGLGVANRDKEDGSFYYEAICTLAKNKDKDENVIEGLTVCGEPTEEVVTCCNKWVVGTAAGYNPNTKKTEIDILKPNEFNLATVFFNIDKRAESGQYVYNVQVYKRQVVEGKAKSGKGEPYGPVQKIYVNVP